jgi:hypothetical protein
MHLNLSAERLILSDLLYQLASKLNPQGKYCRRNSVLDFSAIASEFSETNYYSPIKRSCQANTQNITGKIWGPKTTCKYKVT